MTSEQAMRTVVVLLCTMAIAACRGPDPIRSPYPTVHTWAVAPLRNESGSLAADGFTLADTVARRLEAVQGMHVLPVNRTIQGMQAGDIPEVTTPNQAQRLLETIGADGLVVGTISAYDPYDPPKLGLALELYVNPKVDRGDALDVRRLVRTPTGDAVTSPGTRLKQPVSLISGFFDAADAAVHEQLKHYAIQRKRATEQSWRTYRISMDLYTEFVTDLMCRRLMQAEAQRVRPQQPNAP